MLSIFHYFSAKERLVEHEKTIMMLGGESECQPMILAQRDFIKMELEYYRKPAKVWSIILCILPVIFIFLAPSGYGVISNIVMNCCIK